jgi:hypothetical protein
MSGGTPPTKHPLNGDGPSTISPTPGPNGSPTVGEPFGPGVGEIVLGPSPFRGCFVGGVPPDIPVGLGVGEASGPADGPGVGEPFGPGVYNYI